MDNENENKTLNEMPQNEAENNPDSGANNDMLDHTFGGGRQQTYAIVAYITWIGWLIAMLTGDRNDSYLQFHLNQALVLNIFFLLGCIPYIGLVLDALLFIGWAYALIGACNGEEREIPIIGQIKILK